MSYVCEGEEPEKKSDDDTVIPYDTFDIIIDQKAIRGDHALNRPSLLYQILQQIIRIFNQDLL